MKTTLMLVAFITLSSLKAQEILVNEQTLTCVEQIEFSKQNKKNDQKNRRDQTLDQINRKNPRINKGDRFLKKVWDGIRIVGDKLSDLKSFIAGHAVYGIERGIATLDHHTAIGKMVRSDRKIKKLVEQAQELVGNQGKVKKPGRLLERTARKYRKLVEDQSIDNLQFAQMVVEQNATGELCGKMREKSEKKYMAKLAGNQKISETQITKLVRTTATAEDGAEAVTTVQVVQE